VVQGWGYVFDAGIVVELVLRNFIRVGRTRRTRDIVRASHVVNC
jgi:hypothetical protein